MHMSQGLHAAYTHLFFQPNELVVARLFENIGVEVAWSFKIVIYRA